MTLLLRRLFSQLVKLGPGWGEETMTNARGWRDAVKTMASAAALTAALAAACIGVIAAAQQPGAQASQARAGSADALLGAALHQEEVSGQLDAAIATYRKVLAAADATRAQKARAQFRIGACYEKLGAAQGAEARKAYEAVVGIYSDQSDLAAQAKARLGAMRGPEVASTPLARPSGPVLRQIWPTRRDAVWTHISPDGQSVVGVDRMTNNLVVRNLLTGATRNLTDIPKDRFRTDWADAPAWSRDGLRITYAWWVRESADRDRGEIRVLSIANGASTPVPLDKRYELDLTLGWSADGAAVLADLIDTSQDRREVVAWVSVSDGSVRVLTQPGVINASASPDGAWVAYTGLTRGGGVFIISARGGEPRLVNVTPRPESVAGWSPDGTILLTFSSADRGRDLWAIPVAGGRPSGEPRLIRRLSTTSSLGVSKAGDLLFASAELSTRHVYRADFDSTTGRIGASALISASTGAITSLRAWSPDGRSIAFVGGSRPRPMRTVSVWSMATDQTRAFTLPFDLGSYRLAWSSDGQYVHLVVREERGTGLIRFNVNSGATEPILPPDSGVFPPSTPGQPFVSLVEWSAEGRIVYKSVRDRRETGLGPPVLVEHQLSDHAEREIFRGSEGSVISGVALSPDGREIAIRLVELKPEKTKLILVPVGGGSAKTVAEWPGFGAATVSWTPDGRKLLTPYSTTHADPEERLMCDVQTGAITKLAIPLDQVSDMAVSPDGKSIVYAGGHKQKDDGVWVLENFLPPAKAPTPAAAAGRK